MESEGTGEMESGPVAFPSLGGTVGRGFGGGGVGVGAGACAAAGETQAQARKAAAKIGVKERKGIGTVRFQTATPSIGFVNRQYYREETSITYLRRRRKARAGSASRVSRLVLTSGTTTSERA